jgi:hypothetical protein
MDMVEEIRKTALDVSPRSLSEESCTDWRRTQDTSEPSVKDLMQHIRSRSVGPEPSSIWQEQKAQLVEALRYKPEGRGFDFRWCH